MVEPYYKDEMVTLYLGRCESILPQLEVRADLLLTDPPFGIGFAAQPTKWQRRAGMLPIGWDDSRIVLPKFDAVTQIIWGGNYFELPITRGWLAWYKPDAPPSIGQFELAWTNRETTSRLFIQSISATNAERVGHPTQKPLALMKWCIDIVALGSGALIVDPYAGSCTTLVAAKLRGCRSIGIEASEKYCELAVKERLNRPLPLFDDERANYEQQQIFS